MSTPLSLDLPAGARARGVDTERGTFAALAAGADGPPVLLVPGWTGSKEDYLLVLAPLAEAGYRAVALDQRGQGETPGHDGVAGVAAYSLDTYAADLLAVAARVADESGTDRVHLVGHSLGGLVARRAACSAPDQVATLTLLCSGPAAMPEQRHPLLQALASIIRAHGLQAAWDAKRAYESAQGTPTPASSAEVAAFLQRRFVGNDPNSLSAMTELLAHAVDEVDALHATGLPVLVAFGEGDDGWAPDVQRDMAARLGAPCVSIPGAAHSPAVEQPGRTVQAMVDFWRRVGA